MPYFPPAGGSVILPNSVDNTLLTDMADSTIKGRALGAGLGDPQDLTLIQLRTLLAMPVAQCRLDYVSPSIIRLNRCNGYLLTIDNVPQAIPAAGVDLAPTGLGVGAVFYIYAVMSGGVMVLSPSTNVPTIDARNGMKVMTGNPQYTLVGMARVNTGPAWHTETTVIGMLSYFNRIKRHVASGSSAGWQTASTVFVEGPTNLFFLCWADDYPYMAMAGYATISVAAAGVLATLFINGAAPTVPSQAWSGVANSGGSMAHSIYFPVAEAVLHRVGFGAAVQAGVGSYYLILETLVMG